MPETDLTKRPGLLGRVILDALGGRLEHHNLGRIEDSSRR